MVLGPNLMFPTEASTMRFPSFAQDTAFLTAVELGRC